MPTLGEIFDKRKILLYQNESLDLDHYYQEPYQDEGDEIKEMGKPFETDESKKSVLLIWTTRIEHILASAILWMALAVHTKLAIWYWKERKYFQ